MYNKKEIKCINDTLHDLVTITLMHIYALQYIFLLLQHVYISILEMMVVAVGTGSKCLGRNQLSTDGK